MKILLVAAIVLCSASIRAEPSEQRLRVLTLRSTKASTSLKASFAGGKDVGAQVGDRGVLVKEDAKSGCSVEITKVTEKRSYGRVKHCTLEYALAFRHLLLKPRSDDK